MNETLLMIQGLQLIQSNMSVSVGRRDFTTREDRRAGFQKALCFQNQGILPLSAYTNTRMQSKTQLGTSMRRPYYRLAHTNYKAKCRQYAVFVTGTARTSHTATLYIGYQCALSPSTSINKKNCGIQITKWEQLQFRN